MENGYVQTFCNSKQDFKTHKAVTVDRPRWKTTAVSPSSSEITDFICVSVSEHLPHRRPTTRPQLLRSEPSHGIRARLLGAAVQIPPCNNKSICEKPRDFQLQ